MPATGADYNKQGLREMKPKENCEQVKESCFKYLKNNVQSFKYCL